MQERAHRFGSKHPRLAIGIIWPGFLALTAWITLDAVHEKELAARSAIGLWAATTIGALLTQVYRWRTGRLIVRDPEERVRIQADNAAWVSRWQGAMVGGALALSAIAGVLGLPVVPVLMCLFGGFLLGYGPLLFWVLWVVRPDQREGEWL